MKILSILNNKEKQCSFCQYDLLKFEVRKTHSKDTSFFLCPNCAMIEIDVDIDQPLTKYSLNDELSKLKDMDDGDITYNWENEYYKPYFDLNRLNNVFTFEKEREEIHLCIDNAFEAFDNYFDDKILLKTILMENLNFFKKI